jgi:hypothetical protein
VLGRRTGTRRRLRTAVGGCPQIGVLEELRSSVGLPGVRPGVQGRRPVTVDDLLVRVRAQGLTLRADGDRLIVAGPPVVIEQWSRSFRAVKQQILEALANPFCSRCGERGRPLTGNYWTRWTEMVCRSCAQALCDEFDRDGWPLAPWLTEVDR